MYRVQYVETHREGVRDIEAMHERMFQTPETHHYHAEYWENSEED